MTHSLSYFMMVNDCLFYHHLIISDDGCVNDCELSVPMNDFDTFLSFNHHLNYFRWWICGWLWILCTPLSHCLNNSIMNKWFWHFFLSFNHHLYHFRWWMCGWLWPSCTRSWSSSFTLSFTFWIRRTIWSILSLWQESVPLIITPIMQYAHNEMCS